MINGGPSHQLGKVALGAAEHALTALSAPTGGPASPMGIGSPQGTEGNEGPEGPNAMPPNVGVVAVAGWDLRYGAECSGLEASFYASINGIGANPDLSDDLATALCLALSQAQGSPQAVEDAVALAWHIGDSLAAQQARELRPLLGGLEDGFGPFPPIAQITAEALSASSGSSHGHARALADAAAREALTQVHVQQDGPLGPVAVSAEAGVGGASPISGGSIGGSDHVRRAIVGDRPTGMPMDAPGAFDSMGLAPWAEERSVPPPPGSLELSGEPSRPLAATMAPPAALPATLAAGLGLALLGAAWILYHRIAKPLVLRHPNRAALYAAVNDRGSASAGDLAERLGMDRKTAEYHLTYIARHGLLREDRAPGRPRRFAALGTPRAPSPPLQDHILAAIAAQPGMTSGEVAATVGAGSWRVQERVKDLLMAGRLESRVDAGTRRLYPASAPLPQA
jgi:DNA-binding transcriptional ArsR family regulator